MADLPWASAAGMAALPLPRSSSSGGGVVVVVVMVVVVVVCVCVCGVCVVVEGLVKKAVAKSDGEHKANAGVTM